MFQNIYGSNHEKQVILLIISNGEICKVKSEGRWWHYLAVKKLSALLRRITSKHGDFYCPNCLHSFITEEKLESHKKVCGNKDFCNVTMPFENTKILKFNQYEESDKAPCINYAGHECIIERIDGCKNNPENSSTTKVGKHIPSGFSMSTISLFRSIENKNDVYRGKRFHKKFCEFLR